MQKTIFITGSTDGIGLETARMLMAQGHQTILHGRNPAKLENVKNTLGGNVEGYVADLSRIADVEALANAVKAKHDKLNVLINNAGVFHTPEPVLDNGLDIRFVVNAIAPYLLTQRLLPMLGTSGRVVNLSSAAQSPIDLNALAGRRRLGDMPAYAQSKLALTMWSFALARKLSRNGASIIAVNPGSMLGSKMVKEAFGVAGADLRIGADILCRAALTDEFEAASGRYFDNDSGRFASPHPEALDPRKSEEILLAIEAVLTKESLPVA
jgi:NAD(P)-dependent dehydrogenase (short-subunit alcohol dehydrogenase family)